MYRSTITKERFAAKAKEQEHLIEKFKNEGRGNEGFVKKLIIAERAFDNLSKGMNPSDVDDPEIQKAMNTELKLCRAFYNSSAAYGYYSSDLNAGLKNADNSLLVEPLSSEITESKILGDHSTESG